MRSNISSMLLPRSENRTVVKVFLGHGTASVILVKKAPAGSDTREMADDDLPEHRDTDRRLGWLGCFHAGTRRAMDSSTMRNKPLKNVLDRQSETKEGSRRIDSIDFLSY